MGHIRDLAKTKADKNQTIAGIDISNGYQPNYVLIPGKELLVDDLKALSAQAEQLILATDDDREGEAIGWHLLQVLKENDAKTEQQLAPLRVRFTEITPTAIVESIQNPSDSLALSLVQAQETRRILDRLAGFTVSPVLWKKIAPGLSAGRVQSVAMALVVQRERERLLFRETEYWDAQGEFQIAGQTFSSNLVSVNEQPLALGSADFEQREENKLKEASKHKLHLQADAAVALVQSLKSEGWEFVVEDVTHTTRRLNPPTPFITSTLQQEANSRLGLSVDRTMQAAQRLYENGFISYMRTDSNHLSVDAQNAVKQEIMRHYGGDKNYHPRENAPSKKNKSKTKKKNSEGPEKAEPQAAHEAIRPAIQPDGSFTTPSALPSMFDAPTTALYELVYRRTVAWHMPAQVSNATSVQIIGRKGDESVEFTTKGSVIISPGFTLALPSTGRQDSPELPPVYAGSSVEFVDAEPLSHRTQPPPRYNEASMVKQLEALGVGRPSTYASTVKILRDRAYVGSPSTSGDPVRGRAKEVSGPAISAQRAAGGQDFTGGGNARGPLVPSLTAFVVTSLLEKHCPTYVDPSFTSRMEESLDKIANSELSENEQVSYLDDFYGGDEGLAARIKKIELNIPADEARKAELPALNSAKDIGLFVGPWGPYVQEIGNSKVDVEEKPKSASLPSGLAADISKITEETLNVILETKTENGALIGNHPEDDRPIFLKTGRFGAYLQWGLDGEDGTSTHSLPRSVGSMQNLDLGMISDGEEELSLTSMLGVSLEEAIRYTSLPRTIGELDSLPIVGSIGPYGPYLKYNSTFMSLNEKDGDVTTIELEAAQELVKENIINRPQSKYVNYRPLVNQLQIRVKLTNGDIS